MSRRYRKDIMLLVETLDSHGDPFRTATIEIDTKPEVVPRASRVGGKAPTGGKQVDRSAAGGPKKPGPKRKSKADKVMFAYFSWLLLLVLFCL